MITSKDKWLRTFFQKLVRNREAIYEEAIAMIGESDSRVRAE